MITKGPPEDQERLSGEGDVFVESYRTGRSWGAKRGGRRCSRERESSYQPGPGFHALAGMLGEVASFLESNFAS